MNATTDTVDTPKRKRIRRWAKRPTNPNHDANAFLSVRDVHLVVRELEGYLKRLKDVAGRPAAAGRRHARKLVDKLYQVRWSP